MIQYSSHTFDKTEVASDSPPHFGSCSENQVKGGVWVVQRGLGPARCFETEAQAWVLDRLPFILTLEWHSPGAPITLIRTTVTSKGPPRNAAAASQGKAMEVLKERESNSYLHEVRKISPFPPKFPQFGLLRDPYYKTNHSK